ncbi:hypothetical protein JD276_11025 [Leucobacter sp. CSA1]|uniref:D-isomer specific 2-hydroxyacid dehydrogenase NAD-binding domain-containing protein n=1 Tax=Leucobacter chromiisoli TaxID=2796471 RepID=A0A934UW52_9MICO|nr:NAD(P)-dependent oxidoreductase [Leucobacter chromiisoli]MBK0419567.1 hypothetical protein [Leucobacter chromiisoli]
MKMQSVPVAISDDLLRFRCSGGWSAFAAREATESGMRLHRLSETNGDPELAGRIRGLLLSSDPLGAEELERFPSLAAVARFGSGMDTVDVDACAERGVAVDNAPSTVCVEMAGMVVAQVLNCLLDLPEKPARFEREGWESRYDLRRARGVSGTAVGFVGVGRIARRAAASLAALGVEPRFFSRAAADAELGVKPGGRVPLSELLAASDAVVVLSPPRAGSPALLGESEIALMQDHASLVAVSRGGVVDERAALEALGRGEIRHLVLDVFEGEPRPAPHESVTGLVQTPHSAAWGQAFAEGTLREALGKLSSALATASNEP